MKKTLLVTGLVVVGGSYGLIYSLKDKVALTFIVDSKLNSSLGMPKHVDWAQRTVARSLPYSAFCDLTDCKWEIHSTMAAGIQEGLRRHVADDH